MCRKWMRLSLLALHSVTAGSSMHELNGSASFTHRAILGPTANSEQASATRSMPAAAQPDRAHGCVGAVLPVSRVAVAEASSTSVWTRVWFDDLEQSTLEYIHWFNHRRLHSQIGMIPPVEMEATYQRQTNSANTPKQATGSPLAPGRFMVSGV